MHARRQLLARLKRIISEQLGVQQARITEESTWTELGGDSLDRLAMSLAIEDAFEVGIPHWVGEQLDTVGATLDHLLTLIAVRNGNGNSNIRIEAVTTPEQWADMSRIRAQVFTLEGGFPFEPLPGPGESGIWHFLARHQRASIGTLSVVETTGNSQVHDRFYLNFAESGRIARFAQLAILKPYRGRGIFEMLIEAAQSTVIRPNGFAVGWLLYPAAYACSSMLTRRLGFNAEAPLLTTEFGSCHVLVRRESPLPKVDCAEESLLAVETCAL